MNPFGQLVADLRNSGVRHDKTGRNMAIVMRVACDGQSQRATAKEFGISGERVRQILQQWRSWQRRRRRQDAALAYKLVEEWRTEHGVSK